MDEDVVQKKLEKQRKIAEVHGDDEPTLQFEGFTLKYQYLVANILSCNSNVYKIQDLPLCDTLSCAVTVAQLQGGKPAQEYVAVASSFKITVPKSETRSEETHTLLLTGILDGHSGFDVGLFIKAHLQEKLQDTFTKLFNQSLDELHPLKILEKEQELSDRVIWNVLKIIGVELNEENKQHGGSTLSCSLLIDGKDLWTFNLGDSRTFVTSPEKTIPLSEDMRIRFDFPRHLTKAKFDEIEATFKLGYEKAAACATDLQNTLATLEMSLDENLSLKDTCDDMRKQLQSLLKESDKIRWSNSYERGIWKRGGDVWNNRRLNGSLAMPRAIGDNYYTGICHRFKIVKISLPEEFPDSDFCTLVHGCDGLFDTATTDQIADIINKETSPLSKVAVNLAHSSVQAYHSILYNGKPCRADNVSIVMTRLDLRALRTARETK